MAGLGVTVIFFFCNIIVILGSFNTYYILKNFDFRKVISDNQVFKTTYSLHKYFFHYIIPCTH